MCGCPPRTAAPALVLVSTACVVEPAPPTGALSTNPTFAASGRDGVKSLPNRYLVSLAAHRVDLDSFVDSLTPALGLSKGRVWPGVGVFEIANATPLALADRSHEVVPVRMR